ncbi:HNH endonuclease [Pseudobacillus wudalianchiensis]|uniref:HNH nuclease domain-containing protein n=1 Tax=Pseudobacillus wudalianchiensis TaxID=1743143 RepID=A0A1B9AYQ1_9BACI|nr:HNH endonuclease [Bacillus wudalianchiensis]OCA88930.1 hypothetical protein A8F95_05765 [Bacillus wudalianchiensis]
MPIPESINKSHLLQALKIIKEKGISNYRSSTKFDVIYEGVHFPPKEVLREANWLANGSELHHFSGGDESNNFLIRRGFTVVLKGTDQEIVLDYTRKLREGWPEKELLVPHPPEQTEGAIHLDKITDLSNLTVTESEQIIKARIGHSAFKKKLLAKGCKCALCGLTEPAFLIASHIKPWSASTDEERVDVNNGLLLCPNHDALFDKGYLTFDHEGVILLSNKLSEQSRMFLNIHKAMRIQLDEGQQLYMDYHRQYVFLDGIGSPV